MATISGTSGPDNLLPLGTGDTYEGFAGADTINAGGGNDYIVAGGGDDVVFGGAGKDTLIGGGGADDLHGEGGDDSIRGGAGDDNIWAGSGNDVMSGGSGGDTYFYDDTHVGNDIIRDFNPNDDTLDLTGITGLLRENLVIEQDTDNANPALRNDVIIHAAPGHESEFQGTIRLKNVDVNDIDETNVNVACFLRGTLISTPIGDRAVESLAIGDLVTTLDGIHRPVKWIGRRAYKRRFIGRHSEAFPVLVQSGSLGEGLPSRDLMVSGKHAMFFDGAFVRAEDLVNGKTITRDATCELIEYFHVELDTADVIFANGAATETYANHNSRRMFVNWQEYVDLYGAEDSLEPDAHGEFERPYPLVTDADEIAAIAARFEAPVPMKRAA